MAIKTFLSRESLKNRLKSRGLTFKDDELNKVLVEQNYYSLFNGFENLFLDTLHLKTYKNITLDDFKAVHLWTLVILIHRVLHIAHIH